LKNALRAALLAALSLLNLAAFAALPALALILGSLAAYSAAAFAFKRARLALERSVNTLLNSFSDIPGLLLLGEFFLGEGFLGEGFFGLPISLLFLASRAPRLLLDFLVNSSPKN
jgi:hypothetical protein